LLLTLPIWFLNRKLKERHFTLNEDWINSRNQQRITAKAIYWVQANATGGDKFKDSQELNTTSNNTGKVTASASTSTASTPVTSTSQAESTDPITKARIKEATNIHTAQCKFPSTGVVPSAISCLLNEPFRLLVVMASVQALAQELPYVVLPYLSQWVIGEERRAHGDWFLFLASVRMLAQIGEKFEL
jgi:hypothetical protein